MNRKSRQWLRKGAKQQETRFARRRSFLWLYSFIVAGFVGAGTLVWIHSRPQNLVTISTTELPSLRQPKTLDELLTMSPTKLEHCDIARLNLLCADGLTGVEDLKVDASLATLDDWAQHIKSETDRNFHHFRENPAYYYNSEAFYKMLTMAVVLYEDYGIRYDPKWIVPPSESQPDDHFFADSGDVLIHGLVGSRRIGTCSSMPVLYIALGRRLGYPLKLVTTKQHLFMRWDSPTEQFDMDATAKGLNKYDDEFYKTFPFPITQQETKEEGYLKSLSAREELSVFLSIRGLCLTEAGRSAEASASFSAAYMLAPDWKANQVMLADAQQRSSANHIPVSGQRATYVAVQTQGRYSGVPNVPADINPPKQKQIQTPTP